MSLRGCCRMNNVASFVYHRVERRPLGVLIFNGKIARGRFDVVVFIGSRYVPIKEAVFRYDTVNGRSIG